MGTDLTYNGVTLYNVLTREFDQQPVYDSSGTDVIYHRFIVRVDSILNGAALLVQNPLGGIPPGSSATEAIAIIMARVHRQLSQNRGILSYTVEGTELLHADPCLANSQSADCNNGPRVLNLAITHVSPKTLRISFSVEACLKICEQNTQNIVLNNRWASTDDIDEDFRVTRTWRGLLRFKQAIKSAHDFRGLVVPPLLHGWKRISMNFTAEANALELQYQVVDRQMLGVSPPAPATRMRFTHAESMRQSGQYAEAMVSVRLDGPRDADKKQMLQRCMQILDAKLDLDPTKENGYMQELTCVDFNDQDTNGIEVQARFLRTVLIDNDAGVLLLEDFGRPLDQLDLVNWNPEEAVLKDAYAGADLANLFACYLQSPCSSLHGYVNGTGPAPSEGQGDGKGQNESKPKITYTQGKATDQIKPVSWSDDQKQAIYTYFRLESVIERTENRVALPIARQDSSSQTGGADQDTLAVLRMAPATAKRRIKLSCERIGKWPVIWKPIDFEAGGFKHKLLWCDTNHRPPEPTGDGRKIHAIDAEYLFGLNRAPKSDEPLPVGATFWDTFSAPNNAFSSQYYIEPTGNKGLG